jgi:signal transduction histidine kinase/DNA-binding LacI/PurR family transcriptional regulator/DNA-binding response OmpR family regulator
MGKKSQAKPNSDTRSENAGPLPGSRPTIAYLSSSPGGVYNYEKWQLWRGIAEAAAEWGANIIYVAGEEYDASPQAVLYELIGAHNVDGLIFWNSFFSPRSLIEATQVFISRYFPLPIVAIELEAAGCANLLLENAQGVHDLLAHLIDGHGYRRIAFDTEARNYASKAREIAFEHTMREYGLFDPALVGSLADLDRRELRAGFDYQAVLAHSDEEAGKIIEAFRERGIRVPEDVAVTGFNDGQEARGTIPPLTTVRLPFRKMGQRAVEMLVQRIAGQEVSDEVHIPLRLILRRSCGCLEPLAEQAAAGQMHRPENTLAEALSGQRELILFELARGMGTSLEGLANGWSGKLLDIFAAELARFEAGSSACPPSHTYLRDLNDILRQAVAEGSNVSRWHEAITTLRGNLLPYLQGETLAFAEDLWQQARVMVGQAAVRAEVHRNWETAQRAEILREIESSLLISFNMDEFETILVQGLARLGIPNFYLVLYEEKFQPDGWSRLGLAYEDGRRVELDPERTRFPTRQLLPEGFLPGDDRSSLLIEALHMRDEPIGFAVFKTDPPPDASQCEIYQALRIQISSALKGVRLRQKLHGALRQAEEANQLKSRFLSMVSHELRTPLNLIVGLSEMALRQQSRGDKASPEVLGKLMEQIYVSGQHLDRLIRDVLDLASSQVGQMNLICKAVDLIPVLKDVACMGRQLAEQKNLAFREEIPERLPCIWGDKTRLRQILLNLLSNAVKFTAHGEVVLSASLNAGEIQISVHDTGLGIPPADQAKIFDEFHQSDRTMVRGYGGIGLGLAITRRLVEMHQGRIWVTSRGTEDSGSTFNFTLPVMEEDQVAEPEPVIRKDGTVLILTKSAGSAQQLSYHLTQQGFFVEELALEGKRDILDVLLVSPPGAVVLDLAPASEQGWDIMKKLKENPVTQDIPILFYSLLEDQHAGSVVEMEYLVKPVGTDQLVKVLARHGLKSPDRKARRRILIIDDEPGILNLHAGMVTSELPDCQVITARDGLRGLEMMRQENPDLVLLDLMMPELDGFGVLKAMQEEKMLQNIPVIILSGQVLTDPEMARLNQGVAAVLGKGLFTTEETLARIECALSRNKRLGSEAQRLVRQGMAYIHEHYKEPITRSDIAGHLYVNEQYLSRCFNKEIGLSPMTYLSRYRIEQSKRLLEQGKLSITQVALEVGLSSQSYFSRIFQQETGISPSAYQRGKRPSMN